MIAKWRGSEPVRLVVYPVLTIVVGYLVTRGAADADIADLILGALALALGIPAAEYARKQVTPPDHMRAVIADGAEAALDLVDAEVTRRVGPPAVEVLAQVRKRVADLRDGGRHRADQ